MSAFGSRREARERALGLLYEAEAKDEPPAVVVAGLPVEPDPYAARLVRGVQDNATEIDALLSRYARGWKLERMPAVDRALLRLAVYELLAEPDVPTAAVVSEAVELASQYSTDESGRFVNGLLARIATETRGEAGSHKRPTDDVVEPDTEPEAAATPGVTAAVPAEPAPVVPGGPPLALPQPPLGDGVITLRPWQAQDAPALVAAWADPAVARWSAPPARRSLVDAKRWIAATPSLRSRRLALDLVVSSIGPRPEVLGEVGLSSFDDDDRSARIGYWIVPGQRGRGLATRAVRLLTASALNRYGLNTVIATVDPGNRASQVVLRRAGYEHDAVDPSRWTAT